jgi:hypothetical protein
MNAKDLTTVFQLRLLVGFLGETGQYGWWPSGFFTPSSRMFLEPVFPKTAALAQYHAVVEAARRLHDERLSVGSYHLFRLTEEAEQDLHALAKSSQCEQFVAENLQQREMAMEALRCLAGAREFAAPGPMLLGRLDAPNCQDLLISMAGAYRAAFQGEIQTFPYFAS